MAKRPTPTANRSPSTTMHRSTRAASTRHNLICTFRLRLKYRSRRASSFFRSFSYPSRSRSVISRHTPARRSTSISMKPPKRSTISSQRPSKNLLRCALMRKGTHLPGHRLIQSQPSRRLSMQTTMGSAMPSNSPWGAAITRTTVMETVSLTIEKKLSVQMPVIQTVIMTVLPMPKKCSMVQTQWLLTPMVMDCWMAKKSST